MTKPKFIDPEELPFTRDEVYAAARSFLPEDKAALMADHLSECGPDLIRARNSRRVGWRKAGITNADELPLHGWVYSDELLPALAALSSEVATRVKELQQRLETKAIMARSNGGL